MTNQNLNYNFIRPDGVINQKKLFEFLYGKPKVTRDKSGLTPNAQDTGMYRHGNRWESIVVAVNGVMERLFKYNQSLYYFALIQMSGGLRVSEVLNISVYDITPTGLIKIKTSKHGNNKIINASEARGFLLNCLKTKYIPWQDWDRFFIYREYKKIGFPSVQVGENRHAVTHLFRHLQTAELRTINANEKEVASYLGHKNLKSQENYGR